MLSVPDGDRKANCGRKANCTYKDLRVVIRAGNALCSGAMMTETLQQTQAVMWAGKEVDKYEVVGLAGVEDMLWLVDKVGAANRADEENEDDPAHEEDEDDPHPHRDAAGVDWETDRMCHARPWPLGCAIRRHQG